MVLFSNMATLISGRGYFISAELSWIVLMFVRRDDIRTCDICYVLLRIIRYYLNNVYTSVFIIGMDCYGFNWLFSWVFKLGRLFIFIVILSATLLHNVNFSHPIS
ncbi:hypothetical protein RIR_jg31776.t1 [Rhizophagus irregularis DAOM 181602=DAOM 197198]|nr:hypothetical protein RIR_jg31776.t1 [Rhizophagus irregularis DAOM 181602=DAOM 197198]